MKKLLLIVSVGLLLVLGACSDNRRVELSGYDLMNLNDCFLSITDGNEETECTSASGATLAQNYGNYFLDRIESENVLVFAQVLDTTDIDNSEDIILSITFSNIDAPENVIYYEIYQQIFEEITKDLRDLTEINTELYVRFVFNNHITYTFTSINNSSDKDDDIQKRDFMFTTLSNINVGYFDFGFADYLDLLEDKSYINTSLTLNGADYRLFVDITTKTKEYTYALSERSDTHLMTVQEIEDKIASMLEGFDITESQSLKA